ncbi:MAG: hypothetical protein AAF849_24430 [Bacteroidota bacterium]
MENDRLGFSLRQTCATDDAIRSSGVLPSASYDKRLYVMSVGYSSVSNRADRGFFLCVFSGFLWTERAFLLIFLKKSEEMLSPSENPKGVNFYAIKIYAFGHPAMIWF